LLACGDNGSSKPPRDAEPEVPSDAGPPDSPDRCGSDLDCPAFTHRCCIYCGIPPADGGRECGFAWCQRGGNLCTRMLCDPEASGPCRTVNGTSGTCTLTTEIVASLPRMYWVCL
jgi:hypothetical protein